MVIVIKFAESNSVPNEEALGKVKAAVEARGLNLVFWQLPNATNKFAIICALARDEIASMIGGSVAFEIKSYDFADMGKFVEIVPS